MAGLLLYGTPLSHFTRKVRILLHELGVPFELIRPPNLLDAQPAAYGANPLLRIPTLMHDDTTVIESDHIARYIVDTFAPEDRFAVRAPRVADLNRLAVVNGIMAHEVTLILAQRGGLADLNGVAYFRKLQRAIELGLAWLDRAAQPNADSYDYVDIATICMWDHLRHYQLVPSLDAYGRIAAGTARFATRDAVARTSPASSLAAEPAPAAPA
jgi:glutathione S-transferase